MKDIFFKKEGMYIMVRILLFLYVVSQALILIQIKYHQDFLPDLDVLKVIEIVTFIPIILILAQRTRELRKEVFP